LALFKRRPHQRVESSITPAFENLHISGCEQPQQGSPLFDHLIGARKQHRRDFHAECLRAPEINDQLKLGWLLDR
jgi:hypothetical protein